MSPIHLIAQKRLNYTADNCTICCTFHPAIIPPQQCIFFFLNSQFELHGNAARSKSSLVSLFTFRDRRLLYALLFGGLFMEGGRSY